MSAVLPTSAPTYDQLMEKGLAGPNILLNGEGGTGKTHALGTLVDWAAAHTGFEVFYLDIENSLETLLGYWRTPVDGRAPREVPACLHWHQARTQPVSLAQIMQGAKDIAELSYELVTKKTDPNRGQSNPFYKILGVMSNFTDDRQSGKSYGPVDKFDARKILILDSYTELSNAAAKTVVGARPTMAPPDYGMAQSLLMNFLRLATQGMDCSFVMTAHPSRDKDELTGATRTTISTIGTAIQPQIPPLFSEVIYSVREGNKFSWSTDSYGVVSKTRYLGYKANIPQDFGPIFDSWLKRGGK